VASVGCGGASSQQKQNEALGHQSKSDEAASEGRYGDAADHQKKAQEDHHEAVMTAIDKQEPIPAQPVRGDKPAPENK